VSKTLRVTIVLLLAGSLAVITAGCATSSLDSQFRSSFEEQGVPVKSVDVKVVPHEAQLMADQMILNSHGITDARDEELIHATVTLANGEQVTAVQYKDKIYTYNNESTD